VLLAIDRNEPEAWLVPRVVETLRRGGVVVLPTDTVYALACALGDPAAIERLYGVKGITQAKRLSLLVADVSAASRYAKGITNSVFRMMRRVLPGPYTFIFEATSQTPRIMLRKRRTVGIRIPDCALIAAVLAELGGALLATSVRNDSSEFLLEPAEIEARLSGQVDLVVDGGLLVNEPSTVVDLSGDEPVLVRAGCGDVDALGLFE
jgi:tRNA threonylcarbamoyl adenosine modification protein (Sua5/YciO/YrdC/YwlC family)